MQSMLGDGSIIMKKLVLCSLPLPLFSSVAVFILVLSARASVLCFISNHMRSSSSHLGLTKYTTAACRIDRNLNLISTK